MIYFDNAATSFPKPRKVCREIYRCMESYSGNPGRGGHSLSRRAAEAVYLCREKTAAFFGSSSPENVVFTYNDTYALNMAIRGVLHEGGHVLISDMEHNSVYRPIAAMAEEGLISYDIFDTGLSDARFDPSKAIMSIKSLIKKETRLLVCLHSSNICSAVLPVREIGRLCRERGITFILDAAQSAGHIPIDMEEMNIDILCAPGHKGLYGMGGIMLLGNNVKGEPFIYGGSGVNSLSVQMPEEAPERYEAGTLSMPSVAALSAGLDFVCERGAENIHEKECKLFLRLRDMLCDMPHVTMYGEEHVGSVLLFNVNEMPSERVAEELDRCGICVRSGFHCSPLGHKTLGTGENGAVRVSFGADNNMKELETFGRALKNIVGGM